MPTNLLQLFWTVRHSPGSAAGLFPSWKWPKHPGGELVRGTSAASPPLKGARGETVLHLVDGNSEVILGFSHLHDAGWCHWNCPITTEKLMDQSTEPEVSHSCWAWTVDHVSNCCLCVCICVVLYCLTSEDVFPVATIRETPFSFSTTLVCD